METFEVLEKTLAGVQRRGWCQGQAFGVGGRVCVRGAIALVVAPEMETKGHTIGLLEIPAAIAAWRPLEELAGMPVGLWNDGRGRTKTEVITLLQAAIRAEKAKAGIPFDLPTEAAEGERVRV